MGRYAQNLKKILFKISWTINNEDDSLSLYIDFYMDFGSPANSCISLIQIPHKTFWSGRDYVSDVIITDYNSWVNSQLLSVLISSSFQDMTRSKENPRYRWKTDLGIDCFVSRIPQIYLFSWLGCKSRRLSVGVRQRNGYACINRGLTDAYRRMLAEHAAQTRVLMVFVLFNKMHIFKTAGLQIQPNGTDGAMRTIVLPHTSLLPEASGGGVWWHQTSKFSREFSKEMASNVEAEWGNVCGRTTQSLR